MAGRKRAAPADTTSGKRETRSSKVAKTEGAKSAGRAAKGAARFKTKMALSTFKSRAMPLYVDVTTTAPAGEGEESGSVDPGLLARTILTPSTFSTKSFGWKGQKRLAVEFPKDEGDEEAEKVNVILTINAIVIGSKDAQEMEGEHEGEMEGTEEHPTEETSGEAAGPQPEHSPEGEEKESTKREQPTGETEQTETTAS